MDVILVAIAALAISMVVIPLMIMAAPHMELLDRPNPRKVHAVPMPRVGGWGIVFGALLPALFWLPMAPQVQAFLFGGAVLFAVGVWDDARGLSALPKLLVQIVAVTPAILYADMLVTRVPFLFGSELPMAVAIPLTYLGMVGMINATNLSDGLDGLAGGESILSLLAIAWLTYQVEGGWSLLVLATASIGGVLGFLRYNTHPARLFMGDSGSQFLGFTAAYLVIFLSHKVNPAISPVAPLLILGLPIVDVVLVFTDRVRQGVSPFKPMKNHIHHRLMGIGFTHNQTVILIYGVHAAMVATGTFFRYSADALLVAAYLGMALGFLGLIFWAERTGWRPDVPHGGTNAVLRWLRQVKRSAWVTALPYLVMMALVPFVLVFFSVSVEQVPRDFAVMSAVLAAVMLLELIFRGGAAAVLVRTIVYAAAVFVVYLSVRFHPPLLEELYQWELLVWGLILVAIGIGMRISGARSFQTTPMDYLILMVVLALGIFSNAQFRHFGEENFSAIVVKSVILLYGCEMLLNQARSRWNPVTLSVLGALAVMGYRGLG